MADSFISPTLTNMLPVDEAESLILSLVNPLTDTETLPLADAVGRVLAQPINSPLDFPHWDNSAMDGYAVRHADVQQAPTQLTVIEEIPAGVRPQKTVQPGQAARIFTGAMLPAGADTIVIQENTTRPDPVLQNEPSGPKDGGPNDGGPTGEVQAVEVQTVPEGSEERRVGKECRSRWSP